jgi:ATP-dependent helicase YprA (DUF1998 family)
MDVFALRNGLIDAYRDYATSFMRIRDDRIRQRVDEALTEGKLWPYPQIGLNPTFEPGGTVEDLVADEILHPKTAEVFRAGKSRNDGIGSQMTLHRHQVDAIHAAADNRNYVLTTGTGSGKSLSYIIPIVDHVLRNGTGKGVQALVVYPMNALANSQSEELDKFLKYGPWAPKPPVRHRLYTGQEDDDSRREIRDNPPDIILTNYVMLELILTRYKDKKLVQNLGDLRFLVLDELHTYRGRQGSDVALLIRRLREASKSEKLLCVGTSATLSTEGNYEQRQAKVAGVASMLFGSTVRPQEVIGETLRRATPEADLGDPAFVQALTERIGPGTPIPQPAEYDDFVADPLSTWIESTFGLVDEEGRLARATPLAIEGENGGAARLAELTTLRVDACREAIRSQLLAGYEAISPTTKFPAFAFRLHQFLSRGDTVYADLEPAQHRYLTLDRQRFVPGARDKALLPLAFCRACGQDYYVVSRTTDERGTTVVPRDLGDQGGENGAATGFIYLSDDSPWPDDETEAFDRLPAEWFDDDGKLKSSHRNHLPSKVHVHTDGRVDTTATQGDTTVAWWVDTPFRFCLHCGVSYAGRLGRDFARLTTLGSEGRSTATTIMSLSAIRQLRAAAELPAQARKLLSFTDNRQDASLQAGHFNDFVQVTLLRAALWRAVNDAGPEGLAHDEVAQKVFETLGLPFEEYARDPDLLGGAKRDTEKVMREILAYRIYRDLERGWRLTQPNLEQCGLLRIQYEDLDELATSAEVWDNAHPSIADAEPELRRHLLHVLLDTIRRDLAIRVDVLDPINQEAMEKRIQSRIVGSWSPEDERLEYAGEVLTRPRSQRDQREWTFVSARGGFGQFLRRPTVLGKHTLVETQEIIEHLFDGLRRYGLLDQTGEDSDGHPRFQLPAAAMRWMRGDGAVPYQDHIRMPGMPADEIQTNEYFVALYQSVGSDLIGVEAREHTAQVSYEERIDREERFRTAELPVLYCSPTMELGVDISQLNVVNMRNVPPTPANYAQRSGRAGRSGQPALVFTYCAAGSSHDQHFFRQPEKMVAGQVEAPRLELANEDLLVAHVHAVWLAESGLDLGSSIGDVLDLDDENAEPELFPSVVAHLQDGAAQARAKARVQTVLSDLTDVLEAAPWWEPDWIDRRLGEIQHRFEDSLRRWRSLYKSALQQANEQQRIRLRASTPAAERRQAETLRREALRQLDLLRAQSDSRSQSDFYTYRYFAAEGFLPGYSFPRLPLSAFIPGRRGRRDEPEFLQRPRFLAISEFGPQSLIYHEGARYRINRVILPVGDAEAEDANLVTQRAKRCEHCGYLHEVPALPGPDLCARCGEELPGALENLFRLQNVSTVRRDRITSDEEERQRKGYELISGVYYAERNGRLSVQEADVTVGGEPLLHLAYGDTATIWRINLGWKRRKTKEQLGFVLDLERGYWGNNDDAEAEDPEEAMSKRTKRVIPFVEDTRNALLITPARPLNVEAMASLQSAFKAAIQVVFQLEEDELAVEPLPSFDDRKVLLVYESAEGGAGVLRRLVDAGDEPDLWNRIANEALRRCHYDPVSVVDTKMGDVEPCEAACYDCLLSYRNQPDHQKLDRTYVKTILADLRDAVLKPTANTIHEVERKVDSELERKFLKFLEDGGFRLPDGAQELFESAGTRPDFVYRSHSAVIYVDGPAHDYPDRQARDQKQEAAMKDLGFRVIRFHHYDDWTQIVLAHKAVFGEGVTA